MRDYLLGDEDYTVKQARASAQRADQAMALADRTLPSSPTPQLAAAPWTSRSCVVSTSC
jgi:hypothetical protein